MSHSFTWNCLSEESELSTYSSISSSLALFLLDKEHAPSPHAKTGAEVTEKGNTRGIILFIRKIGIKAILKPF